MGPYLRASLPDAGPISRRGKALWSSDVGDLDPEPLDEPTGKMPTETIVIRADRDREGLRGMPIHTVQGDITHRGGISHHEFCRVVDAFRVKGEEIKVSRRYQATL
jgi:hypothetical protein